MTQTRKPRKTRSRSSRGKASHEESRFGIRYLHHHMFTEKTPEDQHQQRCPYECKCGARMSSIYSGKALFLLTLSILVLLIGVTFMLVGYLIPRRSVVYLEKGDGSRKVLDKSAITFNTMLDDFTLVGTVLVSLGALLFCVVLIIPVCRSSPNKKGQYFKAPTDDAAALPAKAETAETASVSASEDRRSFSGASSSSTIQKIPVLALVHNIQPESKHDSSANAGSSGRSREYRKKTSKHKDSFEEEEY